MLVKHDYRQECINPQARSQVCKFPDWPIWDERLRSSRCRSANFFLGPSASKGKKRSPGISHTRRGWSHRVDGGNRTAYRRDSTVPSNPRPKLIIQNDGEMAVAAVAAPMVMALGVVANHAETSRWVLLSSPLSPGQTGEQI